MRPELLKPDFSGALTKPPGKTSPKQRDQAREVLVAPISTHGEY